MYSKLKYILLYSILLFPFQNTFSQNKTINGYVVDEKSGEYLPYATVILLDENRSTTTNSYGYFSLVVDSLNFRVKVSYVGYQPKEFHLSHLSDTLITFKITSSNELEEVIVHGNKENETMLSPSLNSASISMKEIDRIPVIMGEKDALKSIQLLPGFSGGLEGTSGLYVRGGSPDQNLILLDDVPVYNANHLFGFFSVFNTSALKSVDAIKGGFPSRYGGRLSSVIDIKMKEGNNQHYKGEVSVGLIASNFTIEGPILKDKTSFIVSGRRTYMDLFTRLYSATSTVEGEESKYGYYFYDLNAKINHKFTEKSHLFLSFYTGYDKAFLNSEINNYSSQYIDDFNLNWKNRTASLRYNYIIKPNLFVNITALYSRYSYSQQNFEQTNTIDPYLDKISSTISYSFESSSGIKDLGAKIDFDLYANAKHFVKFGAGYVKHKYIPEINYSSYTVHDEETIITDTSYGEQNIYADESYLYIEDTWTLNSHFKTNFGLRFSSFIVQEENYLNLEPRLSVTYLPSNKLSFEAAYSQMTQYTHLLTNSSSGLPTDLWLPSTKEIRPATAEQYSLGSLLKANVFEITVEAFYKNMHNLIEYKDETNYSDHNGSWEDKVESGEGVAYGFEVLLHKNNGLLSGWAGYTLSWSNRLFNNVNNGNPFPSSYDRRHDFSIVLNHKLNNKIDIGLTWVYSSGLPTTLPVQKYTSLDNETTYLYSDRNGYRMPDYHRMDICANFRKEKKRGQRVWSLSIYNLYNNNNSVIISTKEENDRTKLVQYSMFPIMPSISYTFRFK